MSLQTELSVAHVEKNVGVKTLKFYPPFFEVEKKSRKKGLKIVFEKKLKKGLKIVFKKKSLKKKLKKKKKEKKVKTLKLYIIEDKHKQLCQTSHQKTYGPL